MGIFNFFKKKDKAADDSKITGQSPDKERNRGLFAGSILLSDQSFDFDKFVEDLKTDWDIALSDEDASHEGDNMVFYVNGMMVAVSLFPFAVPNDEAVSNAKTNYRWKGAVEAAQAHQAHLFIGVMSGHGPLTDAGISLVKLCSTAMGQDNVLGICTAGTVFAPDFYRDYASFYLENEFYPVMNLIFFGLYSRDEGKTFCSYTYGMKETFLKEDFEVIDSAHSPDELIEFMSDIAAYVIEEDAVLLPGETIGFSEEQKLPITKSSSKVLGGETLKIAF